MRPRDAAHAAADEAAQLLIAAGRSMVRVGVARFADYGLTISDVNPLLRLTQLGPMSPREVLDSSVLLTSAPVVSHSLGRLEKAGLVTRHPHESDGRMSSVEVTREGRRVAALLHQEIRELSEDFFSPLTESEVIELRALLLRCLQRDPSLGLVERYQAVGTDEPMTVLDDAGRFIDRGRKGIGAGKLPAVPAHWPDRERRHSPGGPGVVRAGHSP